MVILGQADLIGKAERRGQLDLVFVLILPVASAPLGAYKIRRGKRLITGNFIYIVDNAVFIKIIGNVEFIAVLVAEAEGHARVHDSLTVQDIAEILLGNVYIGKHLKVGLPADGGAGLFAVCRAYGELLSLPPDHLAFFEVQLVFIPVAPDRNVHVLRRILRCTGAETVQAEGVFVILTLVVGIFAAGIQLAENKLPVISLFVSVPVDRTASAEVLDLYGLVGIAGHCYNIAVSLAGLVY